MAEGFARAYGSDVLAAESAGLAPAMSISPLTHKVMLEKNIDLGHLFPRRADALKGPFDLVVNLSGGKVPSTIVAPVEEWSVLDPIGMPEEVFRNVRDEIEQRVMRLVLAMRNRKPAQSAGQAAASPARVDRHAQPPRK
jgi:arsenate reductase (thioredoxin)